MKTTIEQLDPNKLDSSPTNPRKHCDPKRLAELTESIKSMGVLQPLIVRVMPEGPVRTAHAVTVRGERERGAWSVVKGELGENSAMYLRTGLDKRQAETLAAELSGKTHQIVAGERRWRAALEARLTAVPVIVRELDDRQVMEMQIIENLQRDDLTPLEEAEGLARMKEEFKFSVEEIAARIGKSKPHVYGRLKLNELCEPGKKALAAGLLSTVVAMMIARISEQKDQKKAVEDCAATSYRSALTDARARDYIHGQFMLRLKDATFDTRDAALLPEAGPCSTCPKRSGNQPDLFHDVSEKDTCTDPACFARKREAHTARKLATAAEQGKTVIPQKEAEKLFNKYGDSLQTKEYVEPDDRCEALGYAWDKTWKETLGKLAPEPVLAVDRQGGLRQLLPRDQAMKALKARGLKPKQQSASGSRYGAQERAKAKKKKENLAIALRAAPLIIEALTPAVIDGKHRHHAAVWKLLAEQIDEEMSIDVDDFVAKRRGLSDSVNQSRSKLAKWLKQVSAPGELIGYVLENLLAAKWTSGWNGGLAPRYQRVCKLAGVNLARLAKVQAVPKTKPRAGKKGR